MKQKVPVRGSSLVASCAPSQDATPLPTERKRRGRPRKIVMTVTIHPGMLQTLLGERQAEAAAAAWLRAPLREMRQASRRTAHVAEARQIGMYLAHTVLRRSMTRVGHVFGRDRTTVRHACARVEDMRDRAAVDLALDMVGAAVLHWSTAFATKLSEVSDPS
ncbi:MAG: helix-turn-helix domain-containing protein [Rhabdaerophilum sp.]